MRKCCIGSTVLVALLVLLLSVSFTYAQGAKASAEKKDVQREVKGEMPADTDSYVIGPEDSLYIHVWREELLTRTVPVRMDGKISLPVVNDVQAAGLTPLQLKEALTRQLKAFDFDAALLTLRQHMATDETHPDDRAPLPEAPACHPGQVKGDKGLNH